ncbi:ChaC-like protein [Pigmentiphaga humi]|uniref:glutathione-specific gamma-glutamylcyclotransferase n=1 Tax=Pigmentiphaga humi TaxID=2478468 RepID=A0A3P4B4J8_9BURK|nr:gamma-glutamylcyclotransferase [Pigmentiphaga humi]VCU70568.1 ChaC-like protein [Pigmentiphaga humi]
MHASAPDLPLLTPAQRQASIGAALTGWNGHDDVWVFAYGSLIWNPGFSVAERRMARVSGHHRSLCLWSRVNRGTPANPGLVFGLDRGGSCRGCVLRVAAAEVPAIFAALWDREMMTGAYLPRWLRCLTPAGPVQALAFVIDRRGSGYAGALEEARLLAAIRGAHGRYGACVDYVLDTDRALRDHGIRDRQLERLARLLAPLAGAPADPV